MFDHQRRLNGRARLNRKSPRTASLLHYATAEVAARSQIHLVKKQVQDAPPLRRGFRRAVRRAMRRKFMAFERGGGFRLADGMCAALALVGAAVAWWSVS